MSGNGKILVLGASSFVGRHLVAKLGAERVIATYNTNPIEGFRKFDSTTMAVDDVIDDWSAIDAAVLLLGDTQPDSCIADPERSRAVNVTAIARVVDRLAEKRVPIVFTSSEFVFDGHRGGYAEIDAAEPILLYGAQKLEAESHLAARTPDYAILRLAKIYGLEPGDGTLFTGMLNTVTRGGAVKCAADQRFSPVFVGDVADAIIAAVEKPLRGVYHVCGPVGLSRLDCLNLMIAEAALRQPVDVRVETCSINDFGLPEDRPLDVSMLPDKLVAATGMALMSPAEACRRICERALAAVG